ncbi:hypothetical protein [Streptomyces antimycoticus]|uniref:hypothetical protein n=1 Tax=Streptomyces antimycoticus TaxID=68175 RepID=UPI000A38D19C|nr:hypothetical protein [Streptomyces antimycoticus]
MWEADPSERATSAYRFLELPREVTLSMLAPSSRQLPHAALAEHLATRDDTDPVRLARHLRAAGAVAAVAGPPANPTGPGAQAEVGQGSEVGGAQLG